MAARRAWPRLFTRALVLVLGALVLLAGGLSLSAGARERLGSVGLFPDDGAIHGISPSLNGPKRTADVKVDIGEQVVVTLNLHVQRRDRILGDGSLMLLGDEPYDLAIATGRFVLKDQSGRLIALLPAPVTVTGTDSGERELSQEYVSAKLHVADGPFTLTFISAASTPSQMHVEVTKSWNITAAFPGTLVASQAARALDIELSGSERELETFNVEITGSGTRIGTQTPPSIANNWIDTSGSGELFWLSTLWVVLVLWIASDRRKARLSNEQVPQIWSRFGSLVGALALFSLAQVLLWAQGLIDRSAGSEPPSDIEVSFFWPLLAAPVSSAIVPLVIAWTWSLLFDRRDETQSRRRWPVLIAGAALILAIGVTLFLLSLPVRYDIGENEVLGSIAPLTVAGLSFLAVGASAVIKTLRGAHPFLGGIVVACVGGVFIAIASVFRISWLDMAGHVLAVIVVTAAFVALARRMFTIVGAWGAGVSRWIAISVAAIVIATTGPRVARSSEPIALNDANGMFSLFVDPIRIALAVLLVVGLARAGDSLGVWTRRGLLFVGLILFFRPTTFAGLPLSVAVGGALFALVVLIRRDGATWATPEPRVISDGVLTYVKAVGMRRMDRDYADGLRKQVSAGDVKKSELTATKDEIAGYHYSASTVDAAAMGYGGVPGDPLSRGAFGAAVATVVGLPFAVEPLSDLLSLADDANGPYLLAHAIAIIIGLRFPIYGFAFGFLFPMLRGQRGMTKALLTAAMLVISESLVILIPFVWNDATQGALLLRILQILSVFIALGFAFDLRSLKSASLGLDRVGDLYNINRFAVWASGILVAGAAAFGTSILSSAGTVLLDRITGQSP